MNIFSNIKLLVLVLSNIVSRCVDRPECDLSDFPVDFSSSGFIEGIVSNIQSLNIDPTMFEDIAITELEIIKQVTTPKQVKNNEDIRLNATQFIEKYGYKTEEYQVVTSDGYILSLLRVPSNGTVVFLMHGLFGSADNFATADPDNALVYALASQGYDVWLGNARGNKYSRKHETLSPECAEFWDFSWHEIGIYDLPAMIDFALDKSGHTTMTYIGHSQGTTAFFVMASLLPAYNSKISLMIALSPVAYTSHAVSPLFKIFTKGTEFLYKFLKIIGVNELLPNNDKSLTRVLCGESALAEIFCGNLISFTGGFDRGQFDVKILPVVIGKGLAGASTKQLAHYGQEMVSGKFRMFDYGEMKNEEVYGVPSLPEYPVENITAPVALFYSQNDWISSAIDVEILRKQLPNVVMFYLADKYNHFDFLWASNAREIVNEPIIKLIRQYE